MNTYLDFFLASNRAFLDKQGELDWDQIEATAPNLSALVGTPVAGKLIVKAGGLDALAKMSPYDFLSLGADGKDQKIGYLRDTVIYRAGGEEAGSELARCSALAALKDCEGCDPTGEIGAKMRKELAPTASKRSLYKKRNKAAKVFEKMITMSLGNEDLETAIRNSKLGAKKVGKSKKKQNENPDSKLGPKKVCNFKKQQNQNPECAIQNGKPGPKKGGKCKGQHNGKGSQEWATQTAMLF